MRIEIEAQTIDLDEDLVSDALTEALSGLALDELAESKIEQAISRMDLTLPLGDEIARQVAGMLMDGMDIEDKLASALIRRGADALASQRYVDQQHDEYVRHFALVSRVHTSLSARIHELEERRLSARFRRWARKLGRIGRMS